MKKADSMNNALEDYFRIRFEHKIAIRPRREDCHLSAATRILAKRNELEQVTKDVETRQAWFKDKMAEISAQRKKLHDREEGLKVQMMKFEKFITENDTKRHRGKDKVEEEHRLQAAKDQQIAKMTETLRDLERTKQQLQAHVDKFAHFQDFMAKAAEASDAFEDKNDLLGRLDVLWATKKFLLERDSRHRAELEQQTMDVLDYTEQRMTEVLRLNNLISSVQTSYDEAQKHVSDMENAWMHIKTTAAKKTLLLGQIHMAIHNLYLLCSRYREARLLEHEETVECTSPPEKLQSVCEVLQDITAIHERCKQKVKYTPAS